MDREQVGCSRGFSILGEQSRDSEAAPLSFSTPESQPKTVLVIDDQEIVRYFVTSILERAGYQTLIASGGGGALAIAEKCEGPLDMVLTDLQMPGMSGIDVGRKLTAVRPGIRVLVMTAADTTAMKLPSGWSLIAKPFTPKQLLVAISDALANRMADSCTRQGGYR